MHRISRSTVFVLVVLYVAYVVSDYTTTQWLIANDPQGIENEVNPLAKHLYRDYGMAGMLAAKSLLYVAIGLTAVFVEASYQSQRKVRIFKELTMLALIAYSLVVVVNNSYAIFVISAAEDPATASWVMKTYGITLSITLTALISISYFSRSHRRAIELTMAVAFLLLPIWLMDKIQPLVFHSYSSIMVFGAGIISTLIVVLLLQHRLATTSEYLHQKKAVDVEAV